MANNEKELISHDLYQSLVCHAAHDRKWAEYFLLVNACYETIKHLPSTPEACEQANIEELLIQGLEYIGEAIEAILPGGVKEFRTYMPHKGSQKYST